MRYLSSTVIYTTLDVENADVPLKRFRVSTNSFLEAMCKSKATEGGAPKVEKEEKEEKDEEHPDNTPLQHEGWESLKDKKRRCCTDLIFLVSMLLHQTLFKTCRLHVYFYVIVGAYCRVGYHDGAWTYRDGPD